MSPGPRSSTSIPSAPLLSECVYLTVMTEIAVPAFVHTEAVAIGRAVAVVNEAAVDDRDVDRRRGAIRVRLFVFRRGVVFLIVHQDAVAEIVDDVDVEERHAQRARGVGRNLNDDALRVRVAHVQPRYRQVAAAGGEERRIPGGFRAVQRGIGATDRQRLGTREFDLLPKVDRRHASKELNPRHAGIGGVGQRNGPSKRARAVIVRIQHEHRRGRRGADAHDCERQREREDQRDGSSRHLLPHESPPMPD